MNVCEKVFVPGKPFQPSPLFVGEAKGGFAEHLSRT